MRTVILLVSWFVLLVQTAAASTVNAVIGDASWLARFGAPPGDAPEDLRLRVHLEHVERVLRAAETRHLTEAQRAARARNLDLLATYHAAGVFPRNHTVPGRRPHFIDEAGRICAVGYLVEQTAGREVAEAINRDFEWAFIADIHGEPFDTWVAASGLSRTELAMIQPSYREMLAPEPELRRNLTEAAPEVERCVARMGIGPAITSIKATVTMRKNFRDIAVAPVGHAPFERCVNRAVRMHAGNHFPQHGQIVVAHTYAVKGTGKGGAAFDRTPVQSVLDSWRTMMLDCFDDGEIQKDTVEDRAIALELVIDPAGAITAAKALGETTHERASACMMLQLHGVHLEPFAGTELLTLRFHSKPR